MPIGKHIIIDMWKYDSGKDIGAVLEQAAVKAGFDIKDKRKIKFNPQGESIMVVIAESHLSAHTWPEYNYAAIDVFGCGKPEKTYKAAIEIIRQLNPEEYNMQIIERG